MQQWRERLNTIAAIAGDVGLFGCVLYFIVLKNFSQHVEVRFGVWFTGLCLLYFFNGQLLRRGLSLRTYVACDLAAGVLLCGAGAFIFEMDRNSVWGWIWFLGFVVASVIHCGYMGLNRPDQNVNLLYLDGTIVALIFVQIWEHLRGGERSMLGAFLVLSIGLGFLALLIRAMTEENGSASEGADGTVRGRFPVFVPAVFLIVLVLGMLLSTLFGKGIADVLVGAVLGAAGLGWAAVRNVLVLFERFFLWLATFSETEEAAGLLPEASQDVLAQVGNVETPTIPGWFFGLVIAAVIVLALALVLILGKGRLKRVTMIGAIGVDSKDVRRTSEGLFSLLWKKLKKHVIFAYRFLFHPEDIRVLVECAQNYGKRKKMSRGTGETLRVYFKRLAQQEEISECALRLGELSEQYFYSGKMPVISREEGKKLRKKFAS